MYSRYDNQSYPHFVAKNNEILPLRPNVARVRHDDGSQVVSMGYQHVIAAVDLIEIVWPQ